MYLCRSITNTPLAMIGKCMGGRDHTTVIHGIDKVKDNIDQDDNLRSTVDILKKKLNPG